MIYDTNYNNSLYWTLEQTKSLTRSRLQPKPRCFWSEAAFETWLSIHQSPMIVERTHTEWTQFVHSVLKKKTWQFKKHLFEVVVFCHNL